MRIGSRAGRTGTDYGALVCWSAGHRLHADVFVRALALVSAHANPESTLTITINRLAVALSNQRSHAPAQAFFKCALGLQRKRFGCGLLTYAAPAR